MPKTGMSIPKNLIDNQPLTKVFLQKTNVFYPYSTVFSAVNCLTDSMLGCFWAKKCAN